MDLLQVVLKWSIFSVAVPKLPCCLKTDRTSSARPKTEAQLLL